MHLRLQRRPTTDGAILGQLLIDGVYAMVTLEREAVKIPYGRFPVRLTVSQRATQGSLYSPDPEHRLPIIEEVAGRSGLRFHALNEAEQSDGCVGVGFSAIGRRIAQSRSALIMLVAKIDAAEKANEPVWLTVEDAPPGTMLRA